MAGDNPVKKLNRRGALAAGAAGMAALAWAPDAIADMAEVEELARRLIGKATPKEGKLRLKLKDVAESGANEPIGVSIDSPMTPSDYIKAIHVMAEANPYPVVASWYLTPRSGRAEVNFRMRLAKTQSVRAYAVASDGTVWMARQEIKVTIGGCGG
jgi:sulfur-oxidizing protein SoxY